MVGVCLGSGGARGIAHIVVLEGMEREGVPIDEISGASIGAIIGGLYAAGSLKRFTRDILQLPARKVFSYADLVFPRQGFLQGRKVMGLLERYIPPNLDIEQLQTPLSIVATDYHEGEQVVFRKGNLLQAIRASISIPGIFVPVRYHDSLLIDGGVTNPLPLDLLRTQRAVAVNLYQRKRESEQSRGDAGDVGIMPKKRHPLNFYSAWKRSKGPSVFDILSHTVQIMEHNATRLCLEQRTPDVLIEPYVNELTIMDFGRMQYAYEAGENAFFRMREQMAALR